jgi:hypothetical protein
MKRHNNFVIKKIVSYQSWTYLIMCYVVCGANGSSCSSRRFLYLAESRLPSTREIVELIVVIQLQTRTVLGIFSFSDL